MMKNAFDNTLAIDDLTHMLQLFKQKAYYSQKLLYRYVHEYFDQADTDETKDYLISLFTEQLALVRKYAAFSQVNSLRMILYRFFSRIVEVIHNDRGRLRDPLYKPLLEYFCSLESIIYEEVSVPGGDYVNVLQSIYERSQQFALTLIELLDEKNRKYMIKPKQEVSILFSPKPENPEIKQIIKSPIKLLPSEPSSPALYPKQPNLIQQSLKLLNCLDLDVSHFRSTFLYCKHHDRVIEDDCLERNQLIQTDIIQFRKKFIEWQMRKTRSFSRARRLSNLKEDSQSPLKVMPQTTMRMLPLTPMPWRKRQHSSLNKLDRSNSKQNKAEQYKTVNGFYKTPPKAGLSPKKVLLCFNKLSLRPIEDTKCVIQNSQKKKCRVRGSSRRTGDSMEMLVEGQRIRDIDTKRSEFKVVSDKTFTSNLFHD